MKQKTLLLIAALMAACNVAAQWHPGAEIDINNIKTTLYGTGCFLRNRGSETYDYGYYNPSTGSVSTIYQNSLWIGGLDNNDSLHIAATRHDQVGIDFWSGPLHETDASTDIFTVMEYHHVWKVARADIEALIANPGGDIPDDILTWPAAYAPFIDVDGDGIYNPRNGDYPDILGDMALFCIYNDNYRFHSETGGRQLGVEIHCMLYGFNAPDDEILNNTLFTRQWIYNRSANTYHDTYISSFTDIDIGNPNDDFTGCNVEHGYYYCYNSDDFDEDYTSNYISMSGYGENIPAQIVMILGGPNMDPDGFDNPKYDSNGNQIVDESINGLGFGDGIVDNERIGMTSYYSHYNPYSPSPVIPEDSNYYNVMKCLKPDGQPIEFGGDGFVGVVGPVCKFMYPFDSDTLNWGTGGVMPNGGFNQNGYYWSEETGNNGGPNTPGDRRCLGSMGPFTFESGAVHVIDRAYVTCWFTNGFDRLEMDEWAMYIKNYFLNNLNNK